MYVFAPNAVSVHRGPKWTSNVLGLGLRGTAVTRDAMWVLGIVPQFSLGIVPQFSERVAQGC